MLEINPEKRPSPEELLAHKLFSEEEMKETATETTDSHSARYMNPLYKSVKPKSLAGLKARCYKFE